MKNFISFKSLFTALIMLTIFISCSSIRNNSFSKRASLKEKIVGTWQMCNVKDSIVIDNYGGREGQKRYKLITPESFLVADFIDNSKQMFGAFMGEYTIEANIYTEFIQNTGSGYQKYLAQMNSFELKIDGDYMTLKGVNNNYSPELWKRIK